MAFGRLHSLRVQELKPFGWCGHHPEVGGQSPGRVPGVTPQGLLPTWQFPLHGIRAKEAQLWWMPTAYTVA